MEAREHDKMASSIRSVRDLSVGDLKEYLVESGILEEKDAIELSG
jgi:hypothetical protein